MIQYSQLIETYMYYFLYCYIVISCVDKPCTHNELLYYTSTISCYRCHI